MPAKELTRKGAATRRAIIDTARHTLVTEGYEQLTLRAVAQRCGIKLGNLQYYFPNRDALVITVIQSEADKDIATIAQAMQETDARRAVRNTISQLLTRWRGEGGTVFVILSLLMQHNETYRALHQQIYRNFYAQIETAIACALPHLDSAECALRARLLTALVDGAAMQTGISRKSKFLDRVIEESCRIALAPT